MNKKYFPVHKNLNLDDENAKDICVDGVIIGYDPGVPLGCFNRSFASQTFDDNLRKLERPGLNFHDPSDNQNPMDSGYCIKHCADYLFQYAAIGKGIECRCGNGDAFKAYKVDKNLCNYNCTSVSLDGNSTYACGGDDAYTVYEANYINKPINITIDKKLDVMLNQGKIKNKNKSYIGCFTENHYCNQRVLSGKSERPSDMTVDKCIDFCSGFKYAGLEAGDQCFCDNEYRMGNLDLEHCSTSCPGDNFQICGGPWAISLYKIPLHHINYLILGLCVGISFVIALIVITLIIKRRKTPPKSSHGNAISLRSPTDDIT